MSATSAPAHGVPANVPAPAPESAPPVPSADVDASCAPLLLPFVSAACWLVAASALGLIASLKFHSPNFLADCSWLTYGRVHPAALDSFLYGFAVQAGTAVAIWVLCQSGRAKLAAPALVITGWLLWNTGVTCGVIGILYGENAGFEWLEMPRYGSAPFILGYLMLGVAGLLGFAQRTRREMHISQWFLVSALLWFPWIFFTGRQLLVVWPVRGVMQSVIDWWYIQNLSTVWLGFTALGAAFYLVPKITNRPLHSGYLGIFIFWTLALFGGWGGVPVAAPVPTWLPAMGAFMSALTLVAGLGAVVNLRATAGGWGAPPVMFMLFGAGAWLVSSFMGAVGSVSGVGEVTNFTWFEPARVQVALYGFFAMTMFGVIYEIAPRLVPGLKLCPRLTRAHLWLGMLGIVLYAGPLAIGGIEQGHLMNEPFTPFLAVVGSSLLFLRASTTGELLMAIGNVLLLLNLLGGLIGAAKACVARTFPAGGKVAEVAS